MGAFATRQVILLPFPFSDLSANKLRPALLQKLQVALPRRLVNDYCLPRRVGQLHSRSCSIGPQQAVATAHHIRPG